MQPRVEFLADRFDGLYAYRGKSVAQLLDSEPDSLQPVLFDIAGQSLQGSFAVIQHRQETLCESGGRLLRGPQAIAG